MKILANDGISKSGIALLEKNGFSVIVMRVAQNQLEKFNKVKVKCAEKKNKRIGRNPKNKINYEQLIKI